VIRSERVSVVCNGSEGRPSLHVPELRYMSQTCDSAKREFTGRIPSYLATMREASLSILIALTISGEARE